VGITHITIAVGLRLQSARCFQVAIGLAEEALCKIDPDTAAPDGAEKRYQIGPHYMLHGDN
jgi:hypothetical protein